jgi:hypothetical protein
MKLTIREKADVHYRKLTHFLWPILLLVVLSLAAENKVIFDGRGWPPKIMCYFR